MVGFTLSIDIVEYILLMIFIYQMGKVSSTSIHKSLLQSGFKNNVNCFHVHSLNSPVLNSEKLAISVKEQVTKIITCTREIISRNLSCFMSSLTLPMYDWYVGPVPVIKSFNAEQLQKIFINKPIEVHIKPTQWFDEELSHNFGINVYESLFNGPFKIFKNGKCECLLIRQEDMYKIDYSEIISNFVGRKIRIKAYNCGDKKIFGQKYMKIKKMKFPREFVCNLYGTKYMLHFYNDEIESFFKNWCI
jgi:Putative capsular polysaccharide synthesis protein